MFFHRFQDFSVCLFYLLIVKLQLQRGVESFGWGVFCCFEPIIAHNVVVCHIEFFFPLGVKICSLRRGSIISQQRNLFLLLLLFSFRSLSAHFQSFYSSQCLYKCRNNCLTVNVLAFEQPLVLFCFNLRMTSVSLLHLHYVNTSISGSIDRLLTQYLVGFENSSRCFTCHFGNIQ